jgi:nitrate reductase NapE component
MERFTLDFSLPNIVTIGLVGAFWFLLIVGTYQVAKGGKPDAK